MQSSPTRSPRLTPPEFLGRLDQAVEQFARLVVTGDLRAPVPPCPDWTFADLVAHLGQIHQWATHAVVAGNPDAEQTPAPSDQAALVEWYRNAAEALTGILKQTDPQAEAWTFGPRPRTAAFWFRRQTHETTVHLWDAGIAQNDDQPIDDIVALDGIDELTGMFFPRQVRLGRMPRLDQALALMTTDGRNRWVLAGDGTEPTEVAQATVTGPSEALLLLLWGRISLQDHRLAVSGDEAVAQAVLSSALVP